MRDYEVSPYSFLYVLTEDDELLRDRDCLQPLSFPPVRLTSLLAPHELLDKQLCGIDSARVKFPTNFTKPFQNFGDRIPKVHPHNGAEQVSTGRIFFAFSKPMRVEAFLKPRKSPRIKWKSLAQI